ncbi:MAG TPA: hypothetical protein VFS59_19080 [Gemmatimonadaceae bacterium]|nr:hypothetical protein [Gemmatimonadaceae bacterium]
MRAIAVLFSLLVVSSGIACSAGQPPAQTERAGARRSDRIARDEIAARNWTDAYELVATLRPQWLVDRGRDSFGSGTVIQVVINGARMGGVAALRRMTASDIDHLQYYSATAATSRWGVGFGKGAIEISTTPSR